MENESSMGFEHFKYTLDAIKNATADKVKAECKTEVVIEENVALRKENAELKLELVGCHAIIDAKDAEIAQLREELAKRDGRADMMQMVQNCIMLERLKLSNAFTNMRSMPNQAFIFGTTLSLCLPGNATPDDYLFMNSLLVNAGCSEKPGLNAGDILTDNATKIVKN